MDIQYFVKRLSQLKNSRRSWEDNWKDCRDFMLPEAGCFDSSPSDAKDKSGDDKQKDILDSTGIRALHVLASGLRTGLTSPSRDWFRFTLDDEDLNKYWAVKLWLDEAEKRVRMALNKSNFYETQFQTYKEIGAFGIGSYAVMEDFKSVVRFIPFTIGEYSIGTDMYNRVNALYREYALTVGQVVEMFGLENCSTRVRADYQNNNKEHWVNIVSAIEPNKLIKPGMADASGMEYISVHWERDSGENKFLKVGGFHEFPCVCPRWTINGNNIYGISPARDARGAVKGLQKLVARSLEAIDKATNPPMVASSSLRRTGGNILPGGITYIDEEGGQFAPAYQVKLDIGALEQKIFDTRTEIKQAMFNDLFMMIARTDKNMTATEVMERQQEKLVMLSPVVERLQTEMLDPLLNRVFMILFRGGMLPPVPEELKGVEVKTKYISLLAQTQEYLSDINGIHQLVGFAGNLMAAYPEVRDKINPDEIINLYGDGLGVSPKIIRSNEEAGAIRQQRAEAAQKQQQTEQMKQYVDSAKVLSDTKIADENALERVLGA